MKRISTPTAVQNKFVDGNKSSGLKSTQLNAEWFNQVQEEICKLLEAAGITVGADDADNQLMQLFTSLFVLPATLKSATCKKSFEGGYSTVTVDGEKISMSAAGDSVTDNSSLSMSRMLLRFLKSTEGGVVSSEISPTGLIVKAVGSDDAVLVEIKNDRITFKSGNPLAEKASIVYDPSTGKLSISTASGVVIDKKIDASTGGLKGDLEADIIEPLTAQNPVTIGSSDGGVALVGVTTGFKGEVLTNSIYPANSSGAVNIGSVAGGVGLSGRSAADRINLSSTSYVKSSSDVDLVTFNISAVEPKVGDIVVVTNNNTGDASNNYTPGDITVTLASRQGSSGEEYKDVTVSAYCSMAFVCILFSKDPNTHEITSCEWSPLSNATVSWNPHVQGA